MISEAQALSAIILIISYITILYLVSKQMRRENFSEEEIGLYQIGAATAAILFGLFCLLSKALGVIS